MTELTVLAVFAAALILCIVLDLSVLTALVFGFFLFLGYGLYRQHSLREMLSMAFSGIKTVKNILITFLLIGIITAVWRAGGTIPCIVYHAAGFCDPRAMVLITFLLCGMISCLRLSNTLRTRLSGRLMRPAFLSFIDGRQPICFIQDCLNTSSIPFRSQISEPRGRPETRHRFADGPSPGGKR